MGAVPVAPRLVAARAGLRTVVPPASLRTAPMTAVPLGRMLATRRQDTALARRPPLGRPASSVAARMTAAAVASATVTTASASARWDTQAFSVRGPPGALDQPS